MAIKNASDLLVYRKFPSGQKQTTRIKVKTNSPLDSTGTIVLSNRTLANGQAAAGQGTLTVSANTGVGVLNVLNTALSANTFLYSVSNAVVEGDFTYRDFTNNVIGSCLTLAIANGTADFDSGALIITVETEGEGSGDKTPIAHSTSASFSISQDYRDITTKDSGGFQQNASGLRSFEISTDALQDYTADLDFQDLFNNIGNRESIIVRFAERDTGGSSDKYYEGNVFVTSLSMDAGVEDNATYSVTFTGTASVTSGTD